MNRLQKVLLAIYSVVFVLLVGLLVYVQFFDGAIDFVTTRHLVPVIFAFLLGIVKIITRSGGGASLRAYKRAYADMIKDAFADDRRKLNVLLKALRLMDEEDFEKSLRLLNSLRESCKNNDERYAVSLFTAVDYNYLEDYEKAAAIYEEMIERGLADSRIFSNVLNCYSEMGEYEKARNAGLAAVHAEPPNWNAFHNFAWFLFGDGKYEEAEDYAKKALELKGNSVETITLLYVLCTLGGRSGEAELYEKKAVANGRSKQELQEIVRNYIGAGAAS